MSDPNIQFGSIDTKTGEFRRGYMENGEMKFKKVPWYRRIFRRKPTNREYLGVVRVVATFSFMDEVEVHTALYKEFNPFTNEVYRVYSEYRGRQYDWNVDAYLRDNRLVPIH